jgi:creatinine amidohydrolase
MRLQDLNWMDVERYLQTDNRIILVIGATEQHAYLSLLTDILIPARIALAVSEREEVLVAPPLNFGVSERFLDFPGTISISQTTFDAILSEMVQSLMQQGFSRFLILNGHGGNQMPTQIQDLHLEGTARILWYDWWRSNAVHAFEAQHNIRLQHANWGENFQFNRVSESPKEDKPAVNLSRIDVGESARDVLGDGSYGGVYQVDDSLMQDLFARVVDEASDLMRQLAVR